MSIQCGTHTQKSKQDHTISLSQAVQGCDMHVELDEIYKSLSEEEGHITQPAKKSHPHFQMILTRHR